MEQNTDQINLKTHRFCTIHQFIHSNLIDIKNSYILYIKLLAFYSAKTCENMNIYWNIVHFFYWMSIQIYAHLNNFMYISMTILEQHLSPSYFLDNIADL